MDIKGIIDTGPILALLNKADPWHGPCAEVYRGLRLPLATTAAVLAEVFHLLHRRRNWNLLEHAWNFVLSDAVTVMRVDDDDLPALSALMAQYSDRPMDFADATLVHVAERESTDFVFTIDHNDFETYRVHDRPFRIEPPRASF